MEILVLATGIVFFVTYVFKLQFKSSVERSPTRNILRSSLGVYMFLLLLFVIHTSRSIFSVFIDYRRLLNAIHPLSELPHLKRVRSKRNGT